MSALGEIRESSDHGWFLDGTRPSTKNENELALKDGAYGMVDKPFLSLSIRFAHNIYVYPFSLPIRRYNICMYTVRPLFQKKFYFSAQGRARTRTLFSAYSEKIEII